MGEISQKGPAVSQSIAGQALGPQGQKSETHQQFRKGSEQ